MLNKLKTLIPVSEEIAGWMALNTESFSFQKNEQLLSAGRVNQYLYFIRSGMLNGFTLIDGKEVCNWISIENDFATSFYSFITRKPSFETIESLEATEVDAIRHDKLMEMYQRFPETERAGRLILEEYYARLEERLSSIQFKSAKERYELLFTNRLEIIRRAPLGRIASLIGITQETLSRIRSGF